MGEWFRNARDAVRRSIGFCREAWQEVKRVHWPSRKQTYAATLVVTILVILVALFLALVDFGLTRVVQMLLR